MPTNSKCASFCLPHNRSGLVRNMKNNPACDGYFGCDDEEVFQDDKKVLLNGSGKNEKQHINYLPWVRRKSPPVLSFFKRVASLRKQKTPKENNGCCRYSYRTLPNPKTTTLGYKCFRFDAGFTSLKRNYCCDGYFGCPPTNE